MQGYTLSFQCINNNREPGGIVPGDIVLLRGGNYQMVINVFSRV